VVTSADAMPAAETMKKTINAKHAHFFGFIASFPYSLKVDGR
jgi:hypothetical protein